MIFFFSSSCGILIVPVLIVAIEIKTCQNSIIITLAAVTNVSEQNELSSQNKESSIITKWIPFLNTVDYIKI